MEYELINSLVTYISRYTPIVVSISVLVFGILITVDKTRSTKMLGISFIFSAIGQFVSGFYMIAIHFLKETEVVNIMTPYNILNVITTCLSLLFFCFFFHKNYGKKLIYLPMFLIPAIGWFADRLVIFLFVRIIAKSSGQIMWVSMISDIDNQIISTAISVIIIITFLKNRKIEKVIPEAWLIRVIMLAFGWFQTVITVFIYLHMKSIGTTVGGMDYMLHYTISSLFTILFPLYVLIKVFKASKEKEQEEPYVSNI